MAVDTYEVIAPVNVHLGDDSVIENFEMESIVIEVMMKGETKRIRNKDVFHMHKSQTTKSLEIVHLDVWPHDNNIHERQKD